MAQQYHFPTVRIGMRLALCALAWLGVSLAAERALAVTATDTLVKYDTVMGTFYIDLFNNLDSALFPSDSPNTVQNFLNHVNNNSYQNSFIHYLATPVKGGESIIQGGGVTYTTSYAPIPLGNSINLEYSRPNTAGTIGMARSGNANDLTSVSNEWFINYGDNSSLLNQADAGGFAVFGQVVGTGMTVVNSIASLSFADFTGKQQGSPTFNIPTSVSGELLQLPLRNYTKTDFGNGTTPTANNLVMINNISVVGTHPAWQNPLALVAGSQQFQFDVNNSGDITALDALTVINFLNGHTLAQDDLSQFVFQLASTGSATFGDAYIDVNGSGKVEALDVLQIINYLNSQPAHSAAMTAPMALAAASVVAPEPGATTLTMLGLLPLAAWAVRRRMRLAGKTAERD